jgi:hypothetical protein
MMVQSEVNLHKLRKRVVSANWSHNGAWASCGQPTFTRHTMLSWNWGGIINLFPIIYFLDAGKGNIVMAKIGLRFPSGSP